MRAAWVRLVRHRRTLGKPPIAATPSPMPATLPRPKPLFILIGAMAATAALMLAMGRPPICTCGSIELWGEVGPKQSQMLADWYSPSHIIHGFLFYAALRWIWPKAPIELRFSVAVLVEALWELLENSPMIIDRYREATIALGYSGDSILNSMSDILMCAIGFLAARRLPLWASLLLVVVLELVPLIVIRDNLTLNIWMLLAPNDAIRAWQAGA